MSIEKNIILASELESAWKKGDVQACYKQLALIPDEVAFRVGDLLFQLVPPLIEEKELMQRSVTEQRELGLVKTVEKQVIIEGFEGGIDLDDISGTLFETVDPEKPAIFSHTHWDINIHPIPAYGEFGFGDIPLFNMFIGRYSLLECRAVFNNEDTVRSIIYKGQVK